MKFNRVFLVVLDSLGVGALEDAKDYNDEGSNTFGNLAKKAGGINIPNMEKMGVGLITDIEGVKKVDNPTAYYTKSKELSVGKDTMTGHWELMGIHTTEPFRVFTDTGFPKELLDELSKATGYEIIGNKAASGTEILDELGEEHMKTKKLIVYTSADSVLQIAAHEDIVPPEVLWDICKKARKITLKEEWKVGRIIARPFIGNKKGEFKRTPNRHDYALSPSDVTTLNYLKDNGYDVISIGKINDIFNTSGITEAHHTVSNEDGMNQLISTLDKQFKGLCFLNLVDFDAVYGHRRDSVGYAKAIEQFDKQLKTFVEKMHEDDLLILTADHGNDPTFPGSDHTREYIPVLIYSPALTNPKQLPVFDTFANIGATISDIFNVETPKIGTSILKDLK